MQVHGDEKKMTGKENEKEMETKANERKMKRIKH